jgi:hypothetical protein
MLPLLGGVVVFAVLALALLAERIFESGRRLPRSRRRRDELPRRPTDVTGSRR